MRAGDTRRFALLVLLALAGPAWAPAQGGAATLTAAQQAGLEDVRRLARETVRLYATRLAVDVDAAPWVGARDLTATAGTGAVYTLGRIYLNPRVLTSPHRAALVAMVLAYHVLRTPSQAKTLADYEREQARLASESIGKAVEILTRAGGLPEPVAFERVHAFLLSVYRAQVAAASQGRRPRTSACDQIRELFARFPQYLAAAADRDCAP